MVGGLARESSRVCVRACSLPADRVAPRPVCAPLPFTDTSTRPHLHVPQVGGALVLLPRRLQSDSAVEQIAALVALACVCGAPAYLSLRARSWYLPRRTAIMALRLAATWILFPMAVPPAGPKGGMAGLVGWAKFLAATRSLDHNLMVWLVPLPFKASCWAAGL